MEEGQVCDSTRLRLLAAHTDCSLISMALKFYVDDRGRARPKISCDVCGGVIENHSGGIAICDSQGAKAGAVLEPSFQCEHCKAKAGGAPPNSMPIDNFFLYLLNNIQLTPYLLEQAERRLKQTVAL
jgi:hypothetical protein